MSYNESKGIITIKNTDSRYSIKPWISTSGIPSSSNHISTSKGSTISIGGSGTVLADTDEPPFYIIGYPSSDTVAAFPSHTVIIEGEEPDAN